MEVKLSWKPTPVVLWIAVTYHWFVAVSTPLMGNRLVGTGAAGLGWFDDYVPPVLFSIVLAGLATLAATGLLCENRFSRQQILMCILPQYAFVLMSLFYCLGIIILGEYRDIAVSRDVSIPIFALFIIVSFGHSYAIIERYWLKWNLMRSLSPDF